MSGRNLITRAGVAVVLGMLIFLVLSTVESQATPIKPDPQKLLQQSQQNQQPFIPARAGWNEPVAAASVPHNPLLESMQEDHMRREFKETLATAATPDPWIALALASVILLMRKLRSLEAQRNRARAALVVVANDTPPARLAA